VTQRVVYWVRCTARVLAQIPFPADSPTSNFAKLIKLTLCFSWERVGVDLNQDVYMESRKLKRLKQHARNKGE